VKGGVLYVHKYSRYRFRDLVPHKRSVLHRSSAGTGNHHFSRLYVQFGEIHQEFRRHHGAPAGSGHGRHPDDERKPRNSGCRARDLQSRPFPFRAGNFQGNYRNLLRHGRRPCLRDGSDLIRSDHHGRHFPHLRDSQQDKIRREERRREAPEDHDSGEPGLHGAFQ